MSARRKQSRRKSRRAGSSPMPSGGAGLMRFFEDSSIGVKIGPITAVTISAALIIIVILAHIGVFKWLFTPTTTTTPTTSLLQPLLQPLLLLLKYFLFST